MKNTTNTTSVTLEITSCKLKNNNKKHEYEIGRLLATLKFLENTAQGIKSQPQRVACQLGNDMDKTGNTRNCINCSMFYRYVSNCGSIQTGIAYFTAQ